MCKHWEGAQQRCSRDMCPLEGALQHTSFLNELTLDYNISYHVSRFRAIPFAFCLYGRAQVCPSFLLRDGGGGGWGMLIPKLNPSCTTLPPIANCAHTAIHHLTFFSHKAQFSLRLLPRSHVTLT